MSADQMGRISTTIALAGFGWVGAAYLVSFAGALMPMAWLLLVAVPALFMAAATYILRFHRVDDAAISLRWWMPVLWIALMINSSVVWSLADRATSGGHIEQRQDQMVLVVHGTAMRVLDAQGARMVAVWDMRQLSSHLLTMLGLVAFGLLAISARSKARPDVAAS
jgi:hypothetical protein